jgi:hypothetical protein
MAGDDVDIDWALVDEKHGKSWTQSLELGPEVKSQLMSGDWTMLVDGEVVNPHDLPDKLDDATVQITTRNGAEIDSFEGVDKIEWSGNPGG